MYYNIHLCYMLFSFIRNVGIKVYLYVFFIFYNLFSIKVCKVCSTFIHYYEEQNIKM